ncbi:hypothetical protein OAI44_07455, partial [Oceanospirillaceae bacterium]|nr:hypothetical protein [Oceanospirillaceae bacterium]
MSDENQIDSNNLTEQGEPMVDANNGGTDHIANGPGHSEGDYYLDISQEVSPFDPIYAGDSGLEYSSVDA